MKLRNRSRAARLHDRLWAAGLVDEDEQIAIEEFVQSISVTSEELETLVARPELSVPEVKRLFAGKR